MPIAYHMKKLCVGMYETITRARARSNTYRSKCMMAEGQGVR